MRTPATALEEGRTHPGTGLDETISPRGSLYIASLDGIRAISFLLVFLAHDGLNKIVPGGFGVSVFFLLSGYLITTLLRIEFSRYQKINFGGFYLRRVLRILPPLYVTLMLAILIYGGRGEHLTLPWAGTLAQALQVSNYYEIYAASAVTIPGTAVFWSLAVEEHFYLLFPLLYAWMCPRFSARRQALVLLGLCAAILAWRCVLHFHLHASVLRTYYGSDTRFDSILFGCVLAVIANPVLRDPLYVSLERWMHWLLPLCSLVLVGTFLERNEGFRETFRYTLQGIALVPLFIAAIVYQKSWPVRMLNLPIVRFVGVLSYSLYLCHYIILKKIEDIFWTNRILNGVLALGAALCFAALVHYGIERPCTRIRKLLSKPPVGAIG